MLHLNIILLIFQLYIGVTQ